MVRIVMVSTCHPYRADTEEEDRENQKAYREKLEAAIAAERDWLDGRAGEPAWPEMPSWKSRPRRRLRLGSWGDDEDDNEVEDEPTHFVDEQTLGSLSDHLIRLTIGEPPPWLVSLAAHLMQWTDEANGPHGEKDRDRDNRPDTWNIHFFDFVGILCVALSHAEATTRFVNPMLKFNDEAFHDAMAAFVRGFDRATLATDTKEPEDPVAVRKLLADRIKQGRNYRRLGREKGFTSESHAGDALNAMFYQPPRFGNTGRPSIPAGWPGLFGTVPVLSDLVCQAPTSGYLATLFLNLVEPSHRADLIPFVVKAVDAWCAAYGVDRNFRVDKDIGSRACVWLDATLTNDPASRRALTRVADDLFRCLDILVQSGVAHARGLEERITTPEAAR